MTLLVHGSWQLRAETPGASLLATFSTRRAGRRDTFALFFLGARFCKPRCRNSGADSMNVLHSGWFCFDFHADSASLESPQSFLGTHYPRLSAISTQGLPPLHSFGGPTSTIERAGWKN